MNARDFCSRFTVYLQQGSQHEPHHIGMCFDARFNYGNDRNVVVRNHKQGNWGQEERHVTHFPFMPNGNFEMIILIEPHCYKVDNQIIPPRKIKQKAERKKQKHVFATSPHKPLRFLCPKDIYKYFRFDA
jgi:hypothetical protein